MEVKNKYPDFNVTPRWLGTVIRDNNMTLKRTHVQHRPEMRYGVVIDFQREIETFKTRIRSHDIDRIITLDETSIQTYMVDSYSRCRIGKRCIETTTDNKAFQKYTLLAAISSRGVIGHKLYRQGGMTSERLVEFLNEFVRDRYPGYLIVMDNAGAHRNELVKNYIRQIGNTVLYTPPYYPQANPIESWFNQLKHYMRRNRFVNNYDRLIHYVTEAIRKIKPEHYENYFKNAYAPERLARHRIVNRLRPTKMNVGAPCNPLALFDARLWLQSAGSFCRAASRDCRDWPSPRRADRGMCRTRPSAAPSTAPSAAPSAFHRARPCCSTPFTYRKRIFVGF